MSIEIVKPIIEDGIEFYVSSDGSEVGVSISGLSRLCGVDRKTIQTLLAAKKTASKTSEALPDELFNLRLEGVNGAKIINSKAATQIIKYYAYESKAANDVAKFSLNKFIDIGFVSWVKQITGFAVTNNNHMLTTTINELYRNMQILTAEMKEWRTVRKVADDHMEGVNILIEEINKNEEFNQSDSDERTYTMAEWLAEHKGITELSHSDAIKIGRSVAQTYKSLRQYKPRQMARYYRSRRTNKPNSKRLAVYTQQDFPILEVAYNEFLLR